tara:strand:+ start:145 stop:552 length:408 start_codon:yes stop_codon:yes gene_type:complete
MMNIGRAAKKSGLPVKTIRYYNSINLVNPTNYSQAGYRKYSNSDVAKLVLISRARKFNFSINECRDLIDLYENKNRPSSEVKRITLKKLREIEAKMTELNLLKIELNSLVSSCKGDDRPDCPIIEFLAQTNFQEL